MTGFAKILVVGTSRSEYKKLAHVMAGNEYPVSYISMVGQDSYVFKQRIGSETYNGRLTPVAPGEHMAQRHIYTDEHTARSSAAIFVIDPTNVDGITDIWNLITAYREVSPKDNTVILVMPKIEDEDTVVITPDKAQTLAVEVEASAYMECDLKNKNDVESVLSETIKYVSHSRSPEKANEKMEAAMERAEKEAREAKFKPKK